MRPEAVRENLLDQPNLPKELRLNDGSRFVVRNREQWLASGDYLIVLVGRGSTSIAYRSITAICKLPQSGRRPRGR